MKKIVFPILALVLLASCNSGPKGETAEATEAQAPSASVGVNYTVDLATSKVSFLGTKPVGTHTGDFKLTEGLFSIAENNIASGKFSIDINSMTITDKDLTYADKLKGHLLSPDFFDAAKFGSATFEITSSQILSGDSVNTHTLSGNLTLKDSTKNVSFPAKVTASDEGVSVVAKFNIDRTQWGLFYGNDKSLGDKFIYPEVQITLNIQAKKN